MLIHGHCPQSMLLGSMVPIPKINGTTNLENFRAITMSSIFVKLFDLVVLEKCQDALNTSNLQFDFKRKSSTATCTFLVQETISYFNYNDSNVYCTLLDASKAFDRLEFCCLFKKLIKRNLCGLVVCLLFYMYMNQLLVVRIK